MPENPYYKDWREVFKWPQLQRHHVSEEVGGQHVRGHGQEEAEHEEAWHQTHKKREYVSQVHSYPSDSTKRTWQVSDLMVTGVKPYATSERMQFVSRHASENEARQAGEARAQKFGVRHYHVQLTPPPQPPEEQN